MPWAVDGDSPPEGAANRTAGACTMGPMRPLTVSINVSRGREAVYDYLDLMTHHELFTDHMMRKWRYHGPERGVGAKASVEVTLGGHSEQVEIEVIETEAPARSVERTIGAGGRRVSTGTYTLVILPGGGTCVTFEYAWREAPWNERLAAPMIRVIMRRALERAMERLAEQLDAPERTDPGAPIKVQG